MAKHKAQQIVPEAALRYWKQKITRESWDYRDIWKTEHAVAFTVAKTARLDVLNDLHEATEKAIREGQSWETFQKSGIAQTLQKKGWWGKKQLPNPETGQMEEVQLGSTRRLRTIYETNMRQSYNAARYESGMASQNRRYILYMLGPSKRHRPDHAEWGGLCLPKDDPFWDTHYPMNGYGCKCWVRFINQRQYDEYRSKGIPEPIFGERDEEAGERHRELKTERPVIEYTKWRNKKTGQIEKVPKGIHPGFDWNPGSYGRSARLAVNLVEKAKSALIRDAEGWLREHFEHPIMRADYQAFVRNAKAGKTKNFSAIGLLPAWALAEFAQRGGKRKRNGKTGLILIDAKLLQAKDDKHERSPNANGLSVAQWLDLPNWLQNYDKVTWDGKNATLVFWKQLSEGWGMAAIGINAAKWSIESIDAKVDHVRTAYIYTEKNWPELMKQRQNRDQLVKEK